MLDPEFKKHLRELAVEVYDRTIDETEKHKQELLFKARSTHNSAALPIAYKEAALYSMELRLSRTIERFICAVDVWGLPIDSALENDMAQEFWSLTAGPDRIQLPPMINMANVQGLQASYSRERTRLAIRLVREGRNRLRELRMTKLNSKPKPSVTTTIIQGDQFNNYGHAGAMGSHSQGTINFQQQWTAIQSQFDLNALAEELEKLKKHILRAASSSSDYVQVALLTEAEEHAKKQEGSKALQVLSKVGKGAFDVAKDIGTEIAARVIAKAMGLEP